MFVPLSLQGFFFWVGIHKPFCPKKYDCHATFEHVLLGAATSLRGGRARGYATSAHPQTPHFTTTTAHAPDNGEISIEMFRFNPSFLLKSMRWVGKIYIPDSCLHQ